MCSRYESIGETGGVEDWFDLQKLSPTLNKEEIRPTNMALIFGMNRQPRVLSWGIPMPLRSGENTQLIINARAETLDKKQTFKPLLNRRCLIPATSWFEWRKVKDNKLKNQIKLKDEPFFTFAGLASDSHFTIITCESASSLSHIHNRMPVVISPDVQNKWLDKQTPFEALAKHLVPYFNDTLNFYEEKPAQFELFT